MAISCNHIIPRHCAATRVYYRVSLQLYIKCLNNYFAHNASLQEDNIIMLVINKLATLIRLNYSDWLIDCNALHACSLILRI